METMQKINFPQLVNESEFGYDPMALGKMKADTLNAIVGNLTGIDCPKCRNTGRIAHPRENGNVVVEECSCMKTRRCIWKMEKSGLKDIIREYTFEKFKATAQWQEKAKEIAAGYAKTPDAWFLICGQSGSGKTHLCTAICRKLLLAGKQVVYMSWRQDVAEIKAASLDSESRAKQMAELKTAEYLYIDDLYKMGAAVDGSIKPTSSDVSIAFEIINHRYINKLPTIVSSELMPAELLAIDEATGGRIIERAKGNTVAISKDTAKNYRLNGVVTL